MIKDINYWLRQEREIGIDGFLWGLIDERLGLKFGVNDKHLLIKELGGQNFERWDDIWRVARHICYKFYSGETNQIVEAEKTDEGVYAYYGRHNLIG